MTDSKPGVVVDKTIAQSKETMVATSSASKTVKKSLKIKILIASVVVLIAAAIAVILLVILPSHQGHQKIIIKTLSGDILANAHHSRRLAVTSNKIQVQQSTSAFSYMKIDGFQSKLLGLSFVDEHGKFIQVADYKSSPRTFEIGLNAATTSVPFEAKAGNYSGLNINVHMDYNLKAYCKTSQYFLYTSTSGLKRVLLSALSDDTLPSDYDYMTVKPLTYLSETDNDHTFNTGTNQAFTYDPATNISSILLDPTNMAACYDGSLSTFEGRGDVLMPFGVHIQGKSDNGYRPDTPAVGLQYLAMFFWAGEGIKPSNSNMANSSTTNVGPIGETYLFTTNLTAMNEYVNTSVFDINQFSTWSIAFNPDDSILAIQARGIISMDFDTTHFKNITRVGTSDTYTLYNGDSGLGQYVPSPAADRIFLNFTRIRGDNYTTVMPVAVVDGPDCVPNTPNNMQSAHAMCRNYTRIMYFRKFPGSLNEETL